MSPKKNSKINDIDRSRLIFAYNNQEDYKALARSLGIKQSSAYNIVKKGKPEKLPCGGRRFNRVDNEMKDVLSQLLCENPQYTIKNINKALRGRLPGKPQVSDITISKTLNGMLYTMKLTHIVPVDRNRCDVVDRRIVYAKWFLQHGVSGHCIYVDESSYNLWCKRSYGRSLKGKPVTRVVSGQRGKSIMLTLAISPRFGIMHFTFSDEKVTKVTFQEFINELGNLITIDEPQYIIFDNAPVHRLITTPNPNIEIIYLPQYSPFLNPIEEAFACWKAELKNQLAEPGYQNHVSSEDEATNAGMNMGQWRTYQLKQVGEHSLKAITAGKCSQWFNHAQSFLPACINKENM